MSQESFHFDTDFVDKEGMSILLDARPEAPDAEPAPELVAKPQFRDDVQGLRAIAVVLVILYHAGFGFEGGFVGVDAFFVLSGFVITRRLRWDVATSGDINLREFFSRRVVRILPAAALMTVVVVLVNIFVGPFSSWTEGRDTALAATLLNANNFLAFGGGEANYFDSTTELNPFLHTWSLSVEEQFYLVFPLLVFAAARLAKRSGRTATKVMLAAFALLSVLSFLASLEALRRNQTWAFYVSPFRAWEFLVGAMIVWLEDRRWRLSESHLMGLVGLVSVGLSSWFFIEGPNFPGVLAIVPVVGTALLILAGSGEQTRLQSILGHSAPAFVGRVSYAWYLWHWPFIVFAKASVPDSTVAIVIAIVSSFAVAVASTLLFEERIRFRALGVDGPVRVLAGAMILTIGAYVASGSVIGWANQSTGVAEFNVAFAELGPLGDQCSSWSAPTDACVVAASGTDDAADVLLLGDSTALQLFAGATGAAEAIDANLTLAYFNGCPTDQITTTNTDVAQCHEFWDNIYADIAADPPDSILLSLAVDVYIIGGGFELLDTDGNFTTDRDRRAEIIATGFDQVVGELRSSVDDVVMAEATPKFSGWFPTNCSLARWSADADACGAERTWEEVDGQRLEAVEIQGDLERAHGIRFVGFDDLLCDEGGCATNRNGEWLFKDGAHISVGQSALLAPRLAEALSESLAR